MDKRQLSKLIAELIREEFLDEMSTTGGASGGLGPPQVPHAFSGKDDKKSVGWRGEEFGVESMPNPDDRRTNSVDADYPAKLQETLVKTSPSSKSHIAFPISKEIDDFEKSVDNYRKSEQEKFINDLNGKLQGKSTKFIGKKADPSAPFKLHTARILKVEGYNEESSFYVVFVTESGKYLVSSEINKKMLIYGEEEAPVTGRIQNKPKPHPSSQNMVKI